MDFITFIPCRLGEPISALDISDGVLAFGSIIGYYGLYFIERDALLYGKECLTELVRAVKIFGKHLYLCNGDENITIVPLASIDKWNVTDYPDLRFHHEICSSYMAELSVDGARGLLRALLVFSPTPDLERVVLERPTDAKVCTYLTSYTEDGAVEQLNITHRLRLLNYSVVMDFRDTRVLYLYRQPHGAMLMGGDPSPFLVVVSDLASAETLKIADIPEQVKLLRFLGDGIVYVEAHKSIVFYELHLRKPELVLRSALSIVAVAVDRELGRAAFIDKGSNVTLWDFPSRRLLLAEQPLKQLAGLSDEMRAYNNFEMGYAYPAALRAALLAFATDFGVFLVKLY